MYYFIDNYPNTCANDCVAKGGGLKATYDDSFTVYYHSMFCMMIVTG